VASQHECDRGGAIDDPSWRGTHHWAGLSAVIGTLDRIPSGKKIGATQRSFPVKTPVPVINGWDASAGKATRCCATCWEKQRKQPHGAIQTGDVGMCI